MERYTFKNIDGSFCVIDRHAPKDDNVIEVWNEYKVAWYRAIELNAEEKGA